MSADTEALGYIISVPDATPEDLSEAGYAIYRYAADNGMRVGMTCVDAERHHPLFPLGMMAIRAITAGSSFDAIIIPVGIGSAWPHWVDVIAIMASIEHYTGRKVHLVTAALVGGGM